jgi:hypothetical protein
MQRDQMSAESTANLCNFYDPDPQIVQAELEQFQHAYCAAVQDIVPVDLISGTGNVHQLKLDDAEHHSESDHDGNTHFSTARQWIESCYAKHYA